MAVDDRPRMVIVAGPPGAGKSSISGGRSFALETTLRSTITFEQARLAREHGFRVLMRYVALDTVEQHIERVQRRAALGGHSASENTLRRIHASSIANLPIALNPQESGIEVVQIYDNSRMQKQPRLVLETRFGRIARLAPDYPAWLRAALGWTGQDIRDCGAPA